MTVQLKKITDGMLGLEAANVIHDNDSALNNAIDTLSEVTDKGIHNLEDLVQTMQDDIHTHGVKIDEIEHDKLPLKADKTELDLKADKSELAGKADKTDLDLKADKSELAGKADKTDLDLKADKSELAGKADKADLDLKADKTDLAGKADKTDLDLKADKSTVNDLIANVALKANQSDVNKLTDTIANQSFNDLGTISGGDLDLLVENKQYMYRSQIGPRSFVYGRLIVTLFDTPTGIDVCQVRIEGEDILTRSGIMEDDVVTRWSEWKTGNDNCYYVRDIQTLVSDSDQSLIENTFNGNVQEFINAVNNRMIIRNIVTDNNVGYYDGLYLRCHPYVVNNGTKDIHYIDIFLLANTVDQKIVISQITLDVEDINNVGSEVLTVEGSLGGDGTTNYNSLSNKPSINGIELSGNKTTDELGIPVPGSLNITDKPLHTEFSIEGTQGMFIEEHLQKDAILIPNADVFLNPEATSDAIKAVVDNVGGWKSLFSILQAKKCALNIELSEASVPVQYIARDNGDNNVISMSFTYTDDMSLTPYLSIALSIIRKGDVYSLLIEDATNTGNPKLLTYAELWTLVQAGTLVKSQVYQITDFQTIYKDRGLNTGTATGANTWNLLVTAISNSKLNSQATILEHPDWIVQYDVTRNNPKYDWARSTDKGQITYLKDNNNNEAFYDFKNIKTSFKKFDVNVTTTTPQGVVTTTMIMSDVYLPIVQASKAIASIDFRPRGGNLISVDLAQNGTDYTALYTFGGETDKSDDGLTFNNNRIGLTVQNVTTIGYRRFIPALCLALSSENNNIGYATRTYIGKAVRMNIKSISETYILDAEDTNVGNIKDTIVKYLLKSNLGYVQKSVLDSIRSTTSSIFENNYLNVVEHCLFSSVKNSHGVTNWIRFNCKDMAGASLAGEVSQSNIDKLNDTVVSGYIKRCDIKRLEYSNLVNIENMNGDFVGINANGFSINKLTSYGSAVGFKLIADVSDIVIHAGNAITETIELTGRNLIILQDTINSEDAANSISGVYADGLWEGYEGPKTVYRDAGIVRIKDAGVIYPIFVKERIIVPPVSDNYKVGEKVIFDGAGVSECSLFAKGTSGMYSRRIDSSLNPNETFYIISDDIMVRPGADKLIPMFNATLDGNVALKLGKKLLGTAKDGTQHELIGIGEYGDIEQTEVGSKGIHLNLNTNNDTTLGNKTSVDTPSGKEIVAYESNAILSSTIRTDKEETQESFDALVAAGTVDPNTRYNIIG